jgi:hypothetical protein
MGNGISLASRDTTTDATNGQIELDSSSANFVYLGGTGGTLSQVYNDAVGVHIGGPTYGYNNAPALISGSLDPNAGAGVAAPVASMYLRNDGAGLGELWFKTGAADTAWTDYVPTYDGAVSSLSGLVHRWKFEEASGNFADSVGSLTLTASGAFTYSVSGGPVSGAAGSVTFGASGKGTSSGLGSIPVGGTARTILLVYKGVNATAKACYFSYGTAVTRGWFTTFINDGVQDTMSLSLFGAGQDVLQTLTPGNMATWHLLAATYDGVQVSSLFIDGRVAAIREGAALNTTN